MVTRGWNGYRNKSQHRKLTLEKIFQPLLWDSNPGPLDHESGTLTIELSPLPEGGRGGGLHATACVCVCSAKSRLQSAIEGQRGMLKKIMTVVGH